MSLGFAILDIVVKIEVDASGTGTMLVSGKLVDMDLQEVTWVTETAAVAHSGIDMYQRSKFSSSGSEIVS